MAAWPFNTREWWILRSDLLAGGPRCAVTPGCRRTATELDHWPVPLREIRAGRAPRELAFAVTNLRPACKSCNSAAGGRLGNLAKRQQRQQNRWGRTRTRDW